MRAARHFTLFMVCGLLCAGTLRAANYPFPPTASWTYSYGIKPANPAGASWSADWTTLAGKWSTYKSNYLSPNGGSPARIICSAQQSGDTVSEGIGYGMILAVYFNDQATFNALWAYEQQHLDGLGLMNWDISSGGSVIGANSASDGDEDMAYALWLAHYQWGDGTTNYTTLATTQTNLVEENDLDGNLRIKPGDSFDSCQYPSYFMPSEYAVFGIRTSNTGTWNTVISNSYQTINDACNTTSGLIAEQTGDTGVGGSCGVSTTEYQYNSCRVPFYMTLDYVYNGTASSKTELTRLQSFFNGIAPGAVDDCYTVNVGGTSSACSSNIDHDAFVGPAGCSLMLSSSSASALQNYYTALMAQGTTSYFDDSWQLLSLLLMQGNMPNIADPAAIYSPTSTPSDTPYAGTPTPTFTQTPVANGVVFEDFEYGQLASGYTFAYTGSTVSQSVTNAQANTGIYSNAVVLNVVKGATYQYGGVGFNSNYANDAGIIDAAGTTSLQISIKNTGTTALSVYVDFKEGGTTTAAVDGGHGYQWDSPAQTVEVLPGWQHFSIPISSFTWDTSNNPTTTPPAGDTGLVLTSVETCQLQTDAVWAGTLYVDDIDFMPTVAFTPTPTSTPLNNPYTQIWDDFESPNSLGTTFTSTTKMNYIDTFADTATGASASWAITSATGDYVDGSHGGALTYNTGTSAGYGCGAGEISPYGNAQLVSNDSGAAFLAYWIKAPLNFRYQVEFQEAGVLTGTVQGADGAAWLSAMQTAAPDSAGWQYVELPIANFVEDPYNTTCNPAGSLPSPCLSEGDTEQMQALQTVSFKLAGGQSSGTLYLDDIAFITTWKTPTASMTPTVGASFTASPSPTKTASPTASPTFTWTVSPSATPTDSPTQTATPTATFTASPSPTSTASPTATRTATSTSSATSTVSPTATPTDTNVPPGSTFTFTGTVSDTPSVSPTGTVSASPTPSFTLSATSTGSPSQSPTLSSTGTVTSTESFTASPSPTSSLTPASPTDTPVDSPTATYTPASPTDTPSPTESQSPTESPTDVWTLTATPSLTASATPKGSATASPSVTVTATPTQTATASATPAGTLTATPLIPVIDSVSIVAVTGTAGTGGYTITVTGSSVAPDAVIVVVVNGQSIALATTVTGTGSPSTLVATAPAADAGDSVTLVNSAVPVTICGCPYLSPLEPISLGKIPAVSTPGPTTGNPIIASQPGPDPNPVGIWVNLAIPVDSVELKVYSMAYRLVGTYSSGALQAGWNELPLPFAPNTIGNGVYYYMLQSQKNGSSLKGPKVGKFYLLGK